MRCGIPERGGGSRAQRQRRGQQPTSRTRDGKCPGKNWAPQMAGHSPTRRGRGRGQDVRIPFACARAHVFPPLPPLLGLHGKGKGSIGMIWSICGCRHDCRVYIIMYRHRAKKLCNSSSSTGAQAQHSSSRCCYLAQWQCHCCALGRTRQPRSSVRHHHPLPAHALLAKERNRQDHGTAHHLTHTTRIIYSSFECLIQNGSETPANSTEFTMMVCVYTQLASSSTG